jgi:hypothetical protein
MSSGNLRKMSVDLADTVVYTLNLSDDILMNDCVGKTIALRWNGQIICSSCSKVTKKSFGDGFCYSCFMNAPEATECTIRPELCRAHLGEGRDPEWENAITIRHTLFI